MRSRKEVEYGRILGGYRIEYYSILGQYNRYWQYSVIFYIYTTWAV